MAFWPFIHFLLKVEMCKTPSFFSASRLICLSMVGIFLQTPSSYLTHFFIVTQSCCYMVCVCVSTVSLSDGQIVISFERSYSRAWFQLQNALFPPRFYFYVKRWITDSRVKKTLPPSIKSIFFKMALDAQFGISLYLHSFPPLPATNQLVFRSLLGLVQDTVLILLSRLLAHSLDPVWKTTGSY